MKKFKALALAAIMIIACIVMTACGNRMWFSDSVKNEIYYALVKEMDGVVYLHEIDKWADSESESAMFTTKCCNNYIWTSANNATFYKQKPTHLNADSYLACGSR